MAFFVFQKFRSKIRNFRLNEKQTLEPIPVELHQLGKNINVEDILDSSEFAFGDRDTRLSEVRLQSVFALLLPFPKSYCVKSLDMLEIKGHICTLKFTTKVLKKSTFQRQIFRKGKYFYIKGMKGSYNQRTT